MAEAELPCGNNIYACAAPSLSERNKQTNAEKSIFHLKASRQPQTAWTERKDSSGMWLLLLGKRLVGDEEVDKNAYASEFAKLKT